MPQKNSSTNPAQAQTKALTKRNFHLPKLRTKLLHKTQEISDNRKNLKKRKILQNLLQPLITNNPDRSVSLRLNHQTLSLQLHLTFRGRPLTHYPKKNVDLQLHLSFNGQPLTHHPKKIVDNLQSYTEAGKTLRRSQTYSHRNGSKVNTKKDKFGLKAHYYGKAEDFMKKILRGEVFIDP